MRLRILAALIVAVILQGTAFAESQLFHATENISAGQLVAIDSSIDRGAKLSSTLLDITLIGVARDDIASGDWGHIIRSNYAICKVDAGTIRGEYISQSSTPGIGVNSGTPDKGTIGRVISSRGTYSYHPSLPDITGACEVVLSPAVKLESGGLGGMSDLVDDTSPQLGGDLDLNGFTIPGVNQYLEVLTQLAVPSSNLDVVDMRSGASWSSPAHVWVERQALSGTNTLSDMLFKVQLPSDFTAFYAGANIYVHVYSNDRLNNGITMYVYDDGGNVDAGVNGAIIEPSADATWELMSDQLTGTYSAGDWIYIRINVDLDSGDYYRVGEMYLRLAG